MTREEFIKRLQADIERWKAEASKANAWFEAIERWIEQGERLLHDLRKPDAEKPARSEAPE